MFQPYKGFAYTIRKRAKANGERNANIQGELGDLLLRTINRHTHPDGFVRLDKTTTSILTEMVHYRVSHKVVYISKAFAEKMVKGKMRFYVDAIKIPLGVFEICFENDTLPSCLVTINPSEAEQNAASRITKEVLNLKNVDMHGLYDDILNFSFAFEDDVWAVQVPLSEFDGKTVDEVAAIKTREIDRKLIRVIFGILAYWNTKQPDIEKWKNHNRGKFGDIKPSEYLIGSKIQNETWFLRSGGPVMLGHPRYRRDETGHIRIIWRKAAEHNPDGRPPVPQSKRKVEDID